MNESDTADDTAITREIAVKPDRMNESDTADDNTITCEIAVKPDRMNESDTAITREIAVKPDRMNESHTATTCFDSYKESETVHYIACMMISNIMNACMIMNE